MSSLPPSWSQPWTKFGDWWDPSNPEQTVSGTLTSDPADGLRLDTNSGQVMNELFQAERAEAVINGRADSEYWTLADCFATRVNFSSMNFRVGYAIAGVDLSREDLAQLTELRLSFHELRWLVRTPRRRPDQLQSEFVPLHATISDGFQLSLVSELTYVDDDPDQLTYRDQLQFVARTGTATTFRDLVNQTYQPLRDLLMLMGQRTVSLNYCAVSGPATTYDKGGRPVRGPMRRVSERAAQPTEPRDRDQATAAIAGRHAGGLRDSNAPMVRTPLVAGTSDQPENVVPHCRFRLLRAAVHGVDPGS